MVEIIGYVARIAVVRLAGRVREGVPDGRAAATLVYRTFHLVAGRR